MLVLMLIYLEYGVQAGSKEAGREALMDLIVPRNGLIQTLCLQHINNWSKCLFMHNTCIMRQACHNSWLDKEARSLDHLQNMTVLYGLSAVRWNFT